MSPWCTTHNRWWKDCPCPGDVRMTATITQELIDETTPKLGAFADAIDRILP